MPNKESRKQKIKSGLRGAVYALGQESGPTVDVRGRTVWREVPDPGIRTTHTQPPGRSYGMRLARRYGDEPTRATLTGTRGLVDRLQDIFRSSGGGQVYVQGPEDSEYDYPRQSPRSPSRSGRRSMRKTSRR